MNPTPLPLSEVLAQARWWRLRISPLRRVQLPDFTGPALRAALGAACRLTGCAQGCDQGPCRVGAGCFFYDAFEPGTAGRPAYRLDTSDLDGRTVEPGEVREVGLVCFSHAGPLLAALQVALARGLDRGRTGWTVRAVEEVSGAALLPALEAAPGERVVELRTPACLEQDRAPLLRPEAVDVLHAIRKRAKSLGVLVGPLPVFGGEVEARLLERGEGEVKIWSARRQQEQYLRACTARWRVRPTPEQAWWLELGRVIGIGGRTAYGFGVLGCLV